MRAGVIDWSYLRGALRWLIAAGACCALMLGASSYYLHQQRLAYEQLSAMRDAAREDFLTAESQGRMTGEYYARYRKLRDEGVIGPERRLDWVEAVQDSARRLHLPKVQYQIMPREPYTLANLPSYPGLTVYSSRMKLEMELLHEGDLAAVFDRLERAAPGALHVQSCSIRRLHDAPDLTAVTPNLAATCEVQWFTVQPEDVPAQDGEVS